MQFLAGTEGVAQLFPSGAQAGIGQASLRRRVAFPLRDRFQHAPSTDARQVRDDAGELEMSLFQQSLQAILQLYPVGYSSAAPPPPSTSEITTANILLCTSIPAIRYMIRSWAGAESVPPVT